jgi:FKBP-type peptidyl-prolyl cis-trans isomerase
MSKLISYLIGLFFLMSCSSPEKEIEPEINWTKEKSTDLGKNLAIQEEIDIKLFLEMHKSWKMTKTGSGLQYYIFEKGEGELVKRGDVAEIEFSIELLDGTKCYQTNVDEYEELVVDQSEIESGIQEAIKLMHVGDHAKLIIPSHIGHGLIGDMDKIPPLTTLVVDLKLLGIKK